MTLDQMIAKRPSLCFLVVAATATLLSVPAYPAEQWQISQVTAVYPMANGSFAISLRDQPAACSSTMTPKRFYVSVGENSVSADGAKEMYAGGIGRLDDRSQCLCGLG